MKKLGLHKTEKGDSMINKKVGFLGAGNMGLSIILGMVGSGCISKHNIFAYDINFSEKVPGEINKARSVSELIQESDIIVFAVKPNVFESVLSEVKKTEGFGEKVYISIAAGITTQYIRDILGNVRVTRVMPNLALSVGEGMTVVCPYEGIDSENLEIVKEIFNSCGKVRIMSEDYIDKALAINGSGPAYVFMFIEALADAGVKNGLSRDDAYFIAAQTVLGSAKMVLETKMKPAELKDMVCSPAGTTIDGVIELENRGFRGAVIGAVDKCTQKAYKMSGK